MKSVIGCMQFCDKSHLSLSAGFHVFYPLHITHLKFSKKRRIKIIMTNKTVRAYLQDRFDLTLNDEVERIRQEGKARRCSKIDTLLEWHCFKCFTRVLGFDCRKPLTKHLADYGVEQLMVGLSVSINCSHHRSHTYQRGKICCRLKDGHVH